MCQCCEPCHSQEHGVCDKDHECGINMHDSTRDERNLIIEGKIRVKNEIKTIIDAL